MRLLAILICAVFSPAAFAQTLISPDTFLDAAVGKTLTFYRLTQRESAGVEQFLRRDLSVWKPEGQDCVYGRIRVQGRQLCFLYDDELPYQETCWHPFLHDDQLMVRLPQVFDAEIQVVMDISDDPLECPNPPTS